LLIPERHGALDLPQGSLYERLEKSQRQVLSV
jgi:hypothetical protein